MNVGAPLTRIEGRAKVTGEARYAADHAPAGLLHAVMVGAPVAAGRVVGIEASACEAGVQILTRHDLPPLRATASPPAASGRLPMQDDTIVYEGEPVALVLAETLKAAEAGAAAVVVHVEAADPAVPAATSDGVLPSRGGYWNYAPTLNLDFAKSDAAAALAGATHRVEARFEQAARHGNPMEPSATIAEWDGDRVTIQDAVQHGAHVRDSIAQAFDIAEEDVRVLSPHTGRGFGTKSFVWPHQFLAVAAARVLRRPVKLVLTRAQMYATIGYQPLTRSRLTLGAGEDGRLAAVEHDCVNLTSTTDDYVEWGTQAAKSLYAVPAMTLRQRVERVNANLPTLIRAPIEGPGLWALESMMDDLAYRLGIDPLDLRLVNHADTDPADGRPWSSKKLLDAYEEGARLFGWRERHEQPKEDGFWRIGRGHGDLHDRHVPFPGRGAGAAAWRREGDRGGRYLRHRHRAADGADPDRRRCCRNCCRSGGGALGRQQPADADASLWLGGHARCRWRRAARHARRIVEAAGPRDFAGSLRAAGVDEVIGDGRFGLPGDADVNENGDGTPHAMRTWGALFVEVGVDPDLGIIRLRRAVGSYSAGRIINPRTARSQMIGGIIWGWGMATMEESVAEPRHGRWLAKNLSNVALPVNADVPGDVRIHFVDEHDPYVGPTGARGIGELGVTGVAPAVANAVFDAVGVRLRRLPMLPDALLGALRGETA